ncbi:PIN-like domain-containing protein [Thalassoroseus pseudoceratinae]|uniref:PIN-like domain-containing protein n=1 Tax=Thalassoroseus pseudoceratinae TaxID=2713176 RepID=UPI00141EA1E4|nr:PIN domain-containing protein [Thalassoroseus pseudoceratinae]
MTKDNKANPEDKKETKGSPSKPTQQQTAGEEAKEAPSLEQVFLRDDVYPDAASLISFQPKSVDELAKTGLVVPDTNVLLLLFKTDARSINEVSKVFKSLAVEKRLYLPGQVAREFVTHRGDHLLAPLQAFERAQSDWGKAVIPRYPFLEGQQEYDECHELCDKLKEQVKLVRKKLGQIKRVISNYSWDDPVSNLYRECFPVESVIDPAGATDFDREKTYQEVVRRSELKIPPGYKDAGKDDGGIGDYLIWLTLIQLGKEEHKSVLFISGDEKADWMERTGKQGIFPRSELIDEFRRESNGETFHMVQLSALLDLYGVDEEVVEGIQELEEAASEQKRSAAATQQPFNVMTELTKQLSATMGYEEARDEAIRRMNEMFDANPLQRAKEQFIAQEIDRQMKAGQLDSHSLEEITRQLNEQFGRFGAK